MSLKNNSRSRRTLKLDDGDLQIRLHIAPSSSTGELADEFGVCKQIIHRHLKQFYFIHKSPCQDPYELTESQAIRQVEICHQLLRNTFDDRLWKCIVTSNGKQVYLVQYWTHRDKQWVQIGKEIPSVPKHDRRWF